MARIDVHLWSGLRRLTDGQLVVPVEAGTIGQMLDALVAAHPGLKAVISAGVSVSVDGTIITNRHAPLTEANEVYLMQQIKGG